MFAAFDFNTTNHFVCIEKMHYNCLKMGYTLGIRHCQGWPIPRLEMGHMCDRQASIEPDSVRLSESTCNRTHSRPRIG